MKIYVRTLLGTAAACVALVSCQVVSRWSAAKESPPTIKHQLPTIDIQQPIFDARYVASTIDRSKNKDGTGKRVYHIVSKPLCSYAAKIKHPQPFDTAEQAEADGCEPCSRCLPRQIARAK